MTDTTTKTEECPICYEMIEGVVNSIVTECGHKFHANCLMKNVAHNGFGCPCCRAKMAEDVIEEEDESDSDNESENDNESDNESEGGSEIENESDIDAHEEEDKPYSEYALLGLRLFTSRIDGEEQDPTDVEVNYTILFPGEPGLPSEEYITEKLLDKGITIYQLVSTLMLDHSEYEGWEYADNTYEDISVKIRGIINDFKAKCAIEGL